MGFFGNLGNIGKPLAPPPAPAPTVAQVDKDGRPMPTDNPPFGYSLSGNVWVPFQLLLANPFDASGVMFQGRRWTRTDWVIAHGGVTGIASASDASVLSVGGITPLPSTPLTPAAKASFGDWGLNVKKSGDLTGRLDSAGWPYFYAQDQAQSASLGFAHAIDPTTQPAGAPGTYGVNADGSWWYVDHSGPSGQKGTVPQYVGGGGKSPDTLSGAVGAQSHANHNEAFQSAVKPLASIGIAIGGAALDVFAPGAGKAAAQAANAALNLADPGSGAQSSGAPYVPPAPTPTAPAATVAVVGGFPVPLLILALAAAAALVVMSSNH